MWWLAVNVCCSPYILFSVYIVVYAIFHTYLPYLAGTLLGASLALVLSYLYVKLYTIPLAGDSAVVGGMVSKIMEIPAVKEHQPLAKYEVITICLVSLSLNSEI